MYQVTIHEAKTHLSRLLKRVAAGEEIIIAHGNKPVARLVGLAEEKPRVFGRNRGLFEVPVDFNEPMPEGWMKDFEA